MFTCYSDKRSCFILCVWGFFSSLVYFAEKQTTKNMDDEDRAFGNSAPTTTKTTIRQKKTKKYIKLVSILIAVVSLCFGFFTFFRNRALEEEKREQTKMFVEASKRFTKELDEQEQALRETTAKMEIQTDILRKMSEQLSQTHRYLVDQHHEMTKQQLESLEEHMNRGDVGATMGGNRRTAPITAALQSLWQ